MRTKRTAALPLSVVTGAYLPTRSSECLSTGAVLSVEFFARGVTFALHGVQLDWSSGQV